jgi:hypothetical protein
VYSAVSLVMFDPSFWVVGISWTELLLARPSVFSISGRVFKKVPEHLSSYYRTYDTAQARKSHVMMTTKSSADCRESVQALLCIDDTEYLDVDAPLPLQVGELDDPVEKSVTLDCQRTAHVNPVAIDQAFPACTKVDPKAIATELRKKKPRTCKQCSIQGCPGNVSCHFSYKVDSNSLFCGVGAQRRDKCTSKSLINTSILAPRSDSAESTNPSHLLSDTPMSNSDFLDGASGEDINTIFHGIYGYGGTIVLNSDSGMHLQLLKGRLETPLSSNDSFLIDQWIEKIEKALGCDKQ